MLPKLVLTDIDGVWTDGGMYYDDSNLEFKKFNTSDSAGVLFLKQLNIPIGIISGEKSNIVSRRAKKLDIDFVYLGIKNKLEIANKICLELKISLCDVAYIGDDVLDIPLLNAVGISAAPLNAPDYVRDLAKIRLTKRGGEGAFREFIEIMLVDNNQLENVISLILRKIDTP